MKPDDPEVIGDDHLYWRAPRIPTANWTKVDENTGKLRVASGAIVINDDGMSGFLRSGMWMNFMCWDAVKNEQINGVVRTQIEDVRRMSFGVSVDSNPDIADDQKRPRDIAHVLLVHDGSMGRGRLDSQRSKLARRVQVVDYPDVKPPDNPVFIDEPGPWNDHACGSGEPCRCRG